MSRVASKIAMIARRATKVAAATVRKGRCEAAGHPPAYSLRVRYWRSQPIAGAAACCDSRTERFAHRVMVATIRCVARLACSPADTLPRSGRLREAGHRRHSRASRFTHRVIAAVILRHQGAQRRERAILRQPEWAQVLWAVCFVVLLAKRMTIRCVARLACAPADTLPRSGRLREVGHGRHSRTGGLRPPRHAAYPVKPSARPCGTYSVFP